MEIKKNTRLFLLLSTLLSISFSAYSIEDDKRKHLVISTAIGAGSSFIFDDYRYSLATCFSIGLAKEFYDQYDYGGFSKEDLMYDAIGCAIGVFSTEHVKLHFKKDSTVLSIQYKF